jgi:hypothetical protein
MRSAEIGVPFHIGGGQFSGVIAMDWLQRIWTSFFPISVITGDNMIRADYTKYVRFLIV